MGVRSKQLNLPELYGVLDLRYGSTGQKEEITISSDNWIEQGNYFVQVISDDKTKDFKETSKLIVHAKSDINNTYEENLEIENLFAHIVKIVSGEGNLTIYSSKALNTSFDIQVLYFG